MAPEWTGKSRGGVSGTKIFVFFIQHAGVNSAYFLLYFVVPYFIFFLPKARKSIYHYFRKRLGYTRYQAMSGIWKNFYRFGQINIDKIAILSGKGKRFSFNMEGEHHLKEIIAQQNGGILISAHIGNWSAAGNLLDPLNTKAHILVYDAEYEDIKQYMNAVQTDQKFNVLTTSADLSHIFKVYEALSKGDLICVHGDRHLEGHRTAKRKFLGEEALFPLGPFILASKFKVPCSFVFAMKVNNRKYHFYASPGKVHKTPEEALDAYIQQLEQRIHEYPEQWFNYYHFWNIPQDNDSC